ncbi:asparagine synthase [Candidatus Scalindua japonica]|uniref:asparagine synthase (glutamine-hydrolyzing) n=1 Tax=Candidatus Scalindua japonica TaxID=1284222 RepID=A0A286U481_9BACT|nr:asparagine synthase (glutamine-hydrolyzing) [Candidatus Scalindua japonica]GAX62932.1 asparagine synthase [Candidatus Scalindua japonica]
MCGISGAISNNQSFISEFLKKSETAQIHRGPDYQGREIVGVGDWLIGLGHQRLSILDLSESGKQPMWSASSKTVIVYNGEVYNYKELKKTSLDFTAKSSTDTEIVIQILEKFGIQTALNQFNGMWAFAWLNTDEKKLYLARDRAGIKPLYYTIQDSGIYFSSEIKGILKGIGSTFAINLEVISEYICQSLQGSTDQTFFEGINIIPAGHFAEIDLSGSDLNINLIKYWDVLDAKLSSDLSGIEARSKSLFFDAIMLRMRSDVPVGVTLSGGVDSSAISAVMKNFLAEEQQLNILSVVSPGSDHDESEFIDIMAEHLQNKVYKVQLGWNPKDTMTLMKKATWNNDSPLGSFSNVAHYLLMKKASELGITVILSGQGADELLCGYKKYLGFYLQFLLRTKKYFKVILVITGFLLNRSVITQFNFQEAKRYLPSLWHKKDIDIRGSKLKSYHYKQLGLTGKQTMQERQADDLRKYSVPFLTHYEDRMSMAWSREIRLPFLDYRLMELFVNLPTAYKLKNGWTKYVFRKAIENILPKQITWRRDKQGFVIPQEQWLKKELKEEILKLFSEDALIFKYQIINREALLQKYVDYCQQKDHKGNVWYREIFNPMALEIWLQVNHQYIDSTV